MLLRRVIEHVKAQNWTAISLDFVIVVIGVFVGIQVSNWNDLRIEREREKTYIQQLAIEVAQMRAQIGEIIEAHDRHLAAMRGTLNALESCDAEAAILEDIEHTFTEYQNLQPVQVIDSVYSEMVSNGMLASLDDDELRRSIWDFYTRVNSIMGVVAQTRLSMPTVDNIVWEFVQLTYMQDGTPTLADFRLQDVCEERKLKNAVVEMIDSHADWREFLSRMTAPADDILNRLRSHPDEATND